MAYGCAQADYFYPRPPRGGRPITRQKLLDAANISIHALREEGDEHFLDEMVEPLQFLSTPSARRATDHPGLFSRGVDISIHALREEGDLSRAIRPTRTSNFYPRPPRGGRPSCASTKYWPLQFLSTPSARRATKEPPMNREERLISIHALREEGDGIRLHPCPSAVDFYPRPPRGGRPDTTDKSKQRMEFLSTPSARRATAKTETKSLFSNKLYNILHEFRRALIYNGSKNYPNHAK